MSLTDIYDILCNVSLDHEHRILMATDVQTLALTDRIELSTVVLAEDLAIWVLLVARLLDMLATAAIGLGLELDAVAHWLGQSQKLLVSQSGYLLSRERTNSRHSRHGLVLRHIISDHLHLGRLICKN